MTKLRAAESRPTTEQRRDLIVSDRSLLCEFRVRHGREVVGKLFHGTSIPDRDAGLTSGHGTQRAARAGPRISLLGVVLHPRSRWRLGDFLDHLADRRFLNPHSNISLRKDSDEPVLLIDYGKTAHLIARHQLERV